MIMRIQKNEVFLQKLSVPYVFLVTWAFYEQKVDRVVEKPVEIKVPGERERERERQRALY